MSKSTGKLICRRYIRGKYLGKGGFARCYALTSEESKRVYAGKVVSKSSLLKSRAKAKLLSEIKIHKDLRNRCGCCRCCCRCRCGVVVGCWRLTNPTFFF